MKCPMYSGVMIVPRVSIG